MLFLTKESYRVDKEGDFVRGNFLKEIHIDKIEKESFLSDIIGLSKFNSISFNKPITFFTGENGTAKSTLIAITGVTC